MENRFKKKINQINPIFFKINLELCSGPVARGVYELQPKALMGRTTLSGPKVAVSIQADLTKPVCVRVECDIATTYGAGDVLPGTGGWEGGVTPEGGRVRAPAVE